jgi:hypothetical protein
MATGHHDLLRRSRSVSDPGLSWLPYFPPVKGRWVPWRFPKFRADTLVDRLWSLLLGRGKSSSVRRVQPGRFGGLPSLYRRGRGTFWNWHPLLPELVV